MYITPGYKSLGAHTPVDDFEEKNMSIDSHTHIDACRIHESRHTHTCVSRQTLMWMKVECVCLVRSHMYTLRGYRVIHTPLEISRMHLSRHTHTHIDAYAEYMSRSIHTHA